MGRKRRGQPPSPCHRLRQTPGGSFPLTKKAALLSSSATDKGSASAGTDLPPPPSLGVCVCVCVCAGEADNSTEEPSVKGGDTRRRRKAKKGGGGRDFLFSPPVGDLLEAPTERPSAVFGRRYFLPTDGDRRRGLVVSSKPKRRADCRWPCTRHRARCVFYGGGLCLCISSFCGHLKAPLASEASRRRTTTLSAAGGRTLLSFTRLSLTFSMIAFTILLGSGGWWFEGGCNSRWESNNSMIARSTRRSFARIIGHVCWGNFSRRLAAGWGSRARWRGARARGGVVKPTPPRA